MSAEIHVILTAFLAAVVFTALVMPFFWWLMRKAINNFKRVRTENRSIKVAIENEKWVLTCRSNHLTTVTSYTNPSSACMNGRAFLEGRWNGKRP